MNLAARVETLEGTFGQGKAVSRMNVKEVKQLLRTRYGLDVDEVGPEALHQLAQRVALHFLLALPKRKRQKYIGEVHLDRETLETLPEGQRSELEAYLKPLPAESKPLPLQTAGPAAPFPPPSPPVPTEVWSVPSPAPEGTHEGNADLTLTFNGATLKFNTPEERRSFEASVAGTD